MFQTFFRCAVAFLKQGVSVRPSVHPSICPSLTPSFRRGLGALIVPSIWPSYPYISIKINTFPLHPGPIDPTKKPVDCEQCRADAIAQLLTQYCYIPICNEDNTFQNYQYDTVKNESFCYTYWGEEIKGSRVEGPGANCTVEEGKCFQKWSKLINRCLLERLIR